MYPAAHVASISVDSRYLCFVREAGRIRYDDDGDNVVAPSFARQE